jgi:hypothetical protein
MKKFAFLLLFAAFAASLTSFTLPKPSLIGKWKGEDGGEVGIITFDKQGYVSFTVNDEVVGGKEYKAEGLVFDMYYETDDSVTPNNMDFVIKIHDGQIEVARMQGIYKFVDDKTLVIHMKFDGTERPTALDDTSQDQITLKKMKK